MLGMPIYVDGVDRGRQTPRNRFLVLYTIVRFPFSIFSCISKCRRNTADTTWVTGDLMRSSEIDHLMVSDSMRYAILM
ncbi:Aspartyl/glutamyl-tRNA(Asn/Gln) amidotransferase subunit B [Bienertia sinuspersici]